MPTQFNPAQLLILKNEFTNDPRGYGYSTNWNAGFDGGLPPIINLKRDGTNPPSNPTAAGGNANGSIRMSFPTVDTGAIRAVTTFTAHQGLVVAERQWFEWLTANGVIGVTANTLQELAGIPTADQSIWAVGDRPAMNAAMENLMRRFASRAEELLGFGITVNTDDVSACRAV